MASDWQLLTGGHHSELVVRTGLTQQHIFYIRKKHKHNLLTLTENVIQWKLLNVITLGQKESDNIIRIIAISNLLLIAIT